MGKASAMTATRIAFGLSAWRASNAFAGLVLLAATPAFAADCAKQRPINIGVAVTPPNVVHTPPYVAKELGYFAKFCIEARIIQFEGGQGAAALAAVAQGQTFTALDPATIAQGLRGKQLWAMA